MALSSEYFYFADVIAMVFGLLMSGIFAWLGSMLILHLRKPENAESPFVVLFGNLFAWGMAAGGIVAFMWLTVAIILFFQEQHR